MFDICLLFKILNVHPYIRFYHTDGNHNYFDPIDTITFIGTS